LSIFKHFDCLSDKSAHTNYTVILFLKSGVNFVLPSEERHCTEFGEGVKRFSKYFLWRCSSLKFAVGFAGVRGPRLSCLQVLNADRCPAKKYNVGDPPLPHLYEISPRSDECNVRVDQLVSVDMHRPLGY